MFVYACIECMCAYMGACVWTRLCVRVCECACVHACELVCACEARGQYWTSSSIVLHLAFWSQGLHWPGAHWLGWLWLRRSSSLLPISPSPERTLSATLLCLAFHLCAGDPDWGPHAPAARLLLNEPFPRTLLLIIFLWESLRPNIFRKLRAQNFPYNLYLRTLPLFTEVKDRGIATARKFKDAREGINKVSIPNQI